MSEQIDLSVIIPAYLEEENLRLLLPRIKQELNSLNILYEVLIIDTIFPKDNTKELCENYKLKYIPREGGNNYGDAVRTGIKYASGKFSIFMDADGSHSPEFIKEFINFKNEYDVVIASRYVKGGGSDNNRILILMSQIVNFIYKLFFGIKCKDISNSFKLYKTIQLKQLNLKCHNFDIVEEILVRLKRKNKNLSIKEIPFLFKERMFGHTKRNLFTFVFSYFWTIIKLKIIK